MNKILKYIQSNYPVQRMFLESYVNSDSFMDDVEEIETSESVNQELAQEIAIDREADNRY